MSNFFTYEQRLDLQKYLKESVSFKQIAYRIGKDPTTISREVRKYSSEVATGYPGFPFNACRNRFNCKLKNICGKDCSRKSVTYCKICSSCNSNCQEYIEEICTVKYRVPYVCNGCETLGKCTLMKNIYDAEHAHIKAHEKISNSRSGLCVSEDEISRLNHIISPLVQNGQSVNQIYINHQDELMCSEKTIYNYIDACLFDVRNIDLPRKVKFRERYKKPEFKVDKGCRIDRNHKDFEAFINKNPDTAIVQMDSVILTDNGSEFSNPKAIEYRSTHPLLRTHVFYCDAGSPYQKGAIEVNHELIRRILPKGSSFNNLTQDDINLMMNHINSYKRKKLNNRSPYETFSFYHGEEVLHKLGCHPVASGDIMLKPALLKK
ncbi:helix-turn-helix domain-containing protein [Clostridium beijerinckii]|uniref:helix-turn-helix domain-containing protein n=1 Tax=Clostridium beijerinckii TaxID=1520 RepID=UPI00080A3F7C|nr:helix-turn-helix domain-containing protein [Clostridium beijerinckii]OCA98005.1 transposase [Clostridium beijerinckii]